MKTTFLWILLALTSASAAAQTQTITYNLENVWLDPDVSNPWGSAPQQMTGQFTWTYDVGDFENGTGELIAIDIPWSAATLAEVNSTIEIGGIEFTLLGNWHDRGLDVSLKFLNDLSTTQPAVIDTALSSFDIQEGISWQGHITSGEVVPEPTFLMTLSGNCPDALQIDINGATSNRQVAVLYGFGVGAFTIPNGYPCAGTVLGLNNSVTLGTTLTADAAGNATYPFNVPPGACGMVYLQGLDLESCSVTSVLLLQ